VPWQIETNDIRASASRDTATARLFHPSPGVAEMSAQLDRRARRGLSAEQVLRALIVKQLNNFSYRDLAFHLADSRSYQTFCRIGLGQAPPEILSRVVLR